MFTESLGKHLISIILTLFFCLVNRIRNFSVNLSSKRHSRKHRINIHGRKNSTSEKRRRRRAAPYFRHVRRKFEFDSRSARSLLPHGKTLHFTKGSKRSLSLRSRMSISCSNPCFESLKPSRVCASLPK